VFESRKRHHLFNKARPELPLATPRELNVDQQTTPPRVGPDASVRDYRRGFEKKRGESLLQTLWHFNVKCANYPTRSFSIAHLTSH